MTRQLDRIYLNPKHPAAFSSVENVKRSVKGFSRKKIQEYLKGVPTYTLHRQIRHRFSRRKTTSAGPKFSVQADLCDYSAYAKDNDGVKFLLTMVDVYTRMLYVEPLKNKSGLEVAKAMGKIFSENKLEPVYLHTDMGKEFYNNHVKELLSRIGCRHYSPSQLKCAMVERMNRTLKTRLEKYMYHNSTRRYVAVLQDFANGINHSINRSIKMRPVEVKSGDLRRSKPEVRLCDLSEGDMVRISIERATFQKGYEKSWSEEEFYISECIPGDPPVYRIKDERGETIEGIFYREELVPCANPQKVYKIEQILKKRIRKGEEEFLVRWLGYNPSFDSWIPANEVMKI